MSSDEEVSNVQGEESSEEEVSDSEAEEEQQNGKAHIEEANGVENDDGEKTFKDLVRFKVIFLCSLGRKKRNFSYNNINLFFFLMEILVRVFLKFYVKLVSVLDGKRRVKFRLPPFHQV